MNSSASSASSTRFREPVIDPDWVLLDAFLDFCHANGRVPCMSPQELVEALHQMTQPNPLG